MNENVRRLSRESEVIRLRSQVEIADAERILQIRTNALNRQMQIQRDRVRILTAELRSLTEAHGQDAAEFGSNVKDLPWLTLNAKPET